MMSGAGVAWCDANLAQARFVSGDHPRDVGRDACRGGTVACNGGRQAEFGVDRRVSPAGVEKPEKMIQDRLAKDCIMGPGDRGMWPTPQALEQAHRGTRGNEHCD